MTSAIKLASVILVVIESWTQCSGYTRQSDFDAVSVTSTSEVRPAKPFKNPEYKAKRDKTLKQILTAEKNSYAGLEVPICMYDVH